MRTFILILALSSIAMTRLLSQADPVNYENPFNSNGCNYGEIAAHYKDQFGTNYGNCMPIISNGWYDKCPPPPGFDDMHTSAYQTHTQNEDVCVVECSNTPQNACGGGHLSYHPLLIIGIQL